MFFSHGPPLARNSVFFLMTLLSQPNALSVKPLRSPTSQLENATPATGSSDVEWRVKRKLIGAGKRCGGQHRWHRANWKEMWERCDENRTRLSSLALHFLLKLCKATAEGLEKAFLACPRFSMSPARLRARTGLRNIHVGSIFRASA